MKRFNFTRLGIASFAFISIFAFATATFAEDTYFFRVDNELDSLINNTGGVTVRFHCAGATGEGSVTDDTASESVQALDGIIKVASTSAEMGAGQADCDATETIYATASFSGFITRSWSDTVSAVGPAVTFTTRASMSYGLKVSSITEELGNALVLNGTTASVSYSGTSASSSYSGDSRYYAASTTGTLTAGAPGYVNGTLSVSAISSTVQKTADFSTGVSSDFDGTPLSFGNVVQVYKSGGTFASNPITSGTVIEGDSGATTCTAGTGSNAGKWYCAVPLSHTATTTTYSGTGYNTTTGTYTDRTTGSDAQTTISIAVDAASCNCGGGGGSSSSTPTPTPTPDASAQPTPTVNPTPTITVIATATPSSGPETPATGITVTNAPPANVAVTFTRTLMLGSRGSDVMSLQMYLKSAGYFNYSGGFTKFFGSVTKKAVMMWQKDNGVTPAIGIFGPKSRAKYNQLMGR